MFVFLSAKILVSCLSKQALVSQGVSKLILDLLDTLTLCAA